MASLCGCTTWISVFIHHALEGPLARSSFENSRDRAPQSSSELARFAFFQTRGSSFFQAPRARALGNSEFEALRGGWPSGSTGSGITDSGLAGQVRLGCAYRASLKVVASASDSHVTTGCVQPLFPEKVFVNEIYSVCPAGNDGASTNIAPAQIKKQPSVGRCAAANRGDESNETQLQISGCQGLASRHYSLRLRAAGLQRKSEDLEGNSL